MKQIIILVFLSMHISLISASDNPVNMYIKFGGTNDITKIPVSLYMDNKVDIQGFQASFKLPDGLTRSSFNVNDSGNIFQMTDRATVAHKKNTMEIFTKDKPNDLLIVVTSGYPGGTYFIGSSGAVGSFTFDASALSDGKYEVKMYGAFALHDAEGRYDAGGYHTPKQSSEYKPFECSIFFTICEGKPYFDVFDTESITFENSEYVYSGQSPSLNLNYKNNTNYNVQLDIPELPFEVGVHSVIIPALFYNKTETFSVNILYTYTIKPASLLIKSIDSSKQYGEQNPPFAVTYTGFVNNENESVLTIQPTVTSTATQTSNVGTYPIVVSGAKAKNYEISYEFGTLTINKAPLYITINNETKVYGENNPSFTLSYDGLKNGETTPAWIARPAFSTAATQKSDVGTYIVSATCEARNYDVTIAEGSLTITPAPLKIIANKATRQYYEENPEFSFTCEGLIAETADALTIMPVFTTDANKKSDVGTYTITPSGATAKNYAIEYKTGQLMITKRPLIAKADDATRLYGDGNPAFSVTYTGFVNNENENVLTEQPSVSSAAVPTSNVGTYPITISRASAKNYEISYEQGIMTINKAPLSVIVNDTARIYGTSYPSFTLSYEGLKNGETVPEWITRPAFSTTATQKSDVGTYTVSATCEARNYDVTINDGNLNITPASLTIKANNASRLYFAENPEFTFSYRGFVNNDNASCLISAPKIDCDATIGSKAGEYVISVYGASAKNYNITYEDAMLTIDKRTLVVTPNNAERIYGEEYPEFTADITGFVNNETEDVISEMPTIYTNAKQTSDVGNYEILAKDGSADNYIFTYKKGTLTIDKADQTITWEQDLAKLCVGDQVELNAVASSGLPIEYIFDSNLAAIYNVGSKQYMDCISEGTFTIRASQSGNRNYNPSVRVSKTVVISDPLGISQLLLDSHNAPIYIDLSGRRILSPVKGSIIIKIDDGKMQKVIVK